MIFLTEQTVADIDNLGCPQHAIRAFLASFLLSTFEAFFAPSVKEPGAMASTENMPPLPEAIAALKDEGNGFFRAGDFLKAAGAYTKALKVRPVARPVSRFRITRLANRRSADARGASL